MKVTKRNGQTEEVSFDKVTRRLRNLCNNIEPKLTFIDPLQISQQVAARIYDGVKTQELDELAAEICATRVTEHIEFNHLASRLVISNNHKSTNNSFVETVSALYNYYIINNNTLVDNKILCICPPKDCGIQITCIEVDSLYNVPVK